MAEDNEEKKFSLFHRLLFAVSKKDGLNKIAKETGLDEAFFTSLNFALHKTDKVDLYPLAAKRGFILVFNRRVSVTFIQNGDSFEVTEVDVSDDGLKAGDVTLLDNLEGTSVEDIKKNP